MEAKVEVVVGCCRLLFSSRLVVVAVGCSQSTKKYPAITHFTWHTISYHSTP